LLGRTDWQPWLRYVVLVVGLAAAVAMFGVRHVPRRVGLAVATAALIAGLAGPTAYSLATAATPHTGSIPSAGPSSTGTFGGFGGRTLGTPPQGAPTTRTQGGANAGGLLDGSTSSDTLNALLTEDASSYTWVAASVGSNSAAGYQLATEEPVMATGGFNGSDPSPTLEQFQQYVADGEIHYFIASGGGFGGGGPGAGGTGSSEITSWVEQSFTAQTVDGVTVYDLSQGVR
jgi:4-amino-4-deoxy-L-arabinose transferase-like glycosyltransferase